MTIINYKTIIWAEMKPDLYDGEHCDKIKPRFEVFCDGDMSSEYTEELLLSAKSFPAGTKISVQLPCCPKCGMDTELCQTNDDQCDFDWELWRDDMYQ